MKNKIVKVYGFYRPIALTKRGLLLFKKNKLFFLDDEKISFYRRLPISGIRGALSISRFATRIMHRYVYCGIASSVTNYVYLAANDRVYGLDLQEDSIEEVSYFQHPDMHRPLSFFEILGVKGFDDCIVYGDYSYNKERHEMSIYALKGNHCRLLYTFPKNTIRHIHSIIPDRFNDRVLVFTGDRDDECGIWETKDNFHSFKPLFLGKQSYRFCCGRAYDDGVVMVTDSPFDQNHVYKMNNRNEIEELFAIKGPVVFFSYVGEKLVFATDVENDEKNLSYFQEFFINKKGDGVLDNSVHVYVYDNSNRTIEEIVSFEKDRWPMRIFGFGTVHFPPSQSQVDFYLYPMSVKRYDQKLVKMRLDGYEDS